VLLFSMLSSVLLLAENWYHCYNINTPPATIKPRCVDATVPTAVGDYNQIEIDISKFPPQGYM